MNTCCICEMEIDLIFNSKGEMIWDKGHNAEPVRHGRCCTTCNELLVVPARIKRKAEQENIQHG